MENDKEMLTSQDNNEITSPTDIKGKDVHETNQTKSGIGGSQIKEGSNLLSEHAKKSTRSKRERAKRYKRKEVKKY